MPNPSPGECWCRKAVSAAFSMAIRIASAYLQATAPVQTGYGRRCKRSGHGDSGHALADARMSQPDGSGFHSVHGFHGVLGSEW